MKEGRRREASLELALREDEVHRRRMLEWIKGEELEARAIELQVQVSSLSFYLRRALLRSIDNFFRVNEGEISKIVREELFELFAFPTRQTLPEDPKTRKKQLYEHFIFTWAEAMDKDSRFSEDLIRALMEIEISWEYDDSFLMEAIFKERDRLGEMMRSNDPTPPEGSNIIFLESPPSEFKASQSPSILAQLRRLGRLVASLF